MTCRGERTRSWRLLFAAVLAFGAVVAAPAGATDYPGLGRLSDADLAQQRGGFDLPGGLDLDFGADVKTYVDGQLALETTLTWTAQGAQIEQIGPGGLVTPLGPGALSTATLSDPSGTIKLIQQLSSQTLANLVLSTASNHTVSQATNFTITLPGFTQTQQGYQQALVGMGLAQQLGMALTRVH